MGGYCDILLILTSLVLLILTSLVLNFHLCIGVWMVTMPHWQLALKLLLFQAVSVNFEHTTELHLSGWAAGCLALANRPSWTLTVTA